MTKPLPWKSLLLLTSIFTLLNVVKPLLIDDAAYYYYAAQIAHHPLDPYGFEMYWYQKPSAALEILAPPLLPYCWAPAIWLFGEQPVLWKLWLMPFGLLFVHALHSVFRRFASGWEQPLTWMTVLSPAFLPSWNLMLDVPALALSLGALVLFFSAIDDDSWKKALFAGVVAGLAMETKYTGFLALATMLLYSLFFGRIRFGILACVVASILFAACEGAIALEYGQSHFLFHVLDNSMVVFKKSQLIRPILTMLGAVAPMSSLWALAAFRVQKRYLWGSAVLVVVSFLLVGYAANEYCICLDFSFLTGDPSSGAILCWEHFIYGILGSGVCGIAVAVVLRLCRLPRGWRRWSRHRVEYFLAFWLLLEVAGYFALTPFPAVRRVLGIAVVGALLAGRLAWYTCRSAEMRPRLLALAGCNIALGLLFYAVNLSDAFAEKWGPERAAEFIHRQDRDAKIWYVGHWGFQHYAERAGMEPVLPGYSILNEGDWLVVPDDRRRQQMIVLKTPELHRVETIRIRDALPFRTIMLFFGGDIPLEHHQGPRLEVTIYQVGTSFVPRSAFPSG